MGRRLTAQQQALAEQAMLLIPAAIKGFLRRHPCMRRDAMRCDLRGAAQIAVVKASFSYDPRKGAMSTYYGTAIQHELQREVKRMRRNLDTAHQERDVEVAAIGMMSDLPREGSMMRALAGMPLVDKHMIDALVLGNATVTSLAIEAGVSQRTMARRLRRALQELARRAEDFP
jgi:DNA-directed RNA polymerase specialized sigma24 family protein